MQGDQEAWHTLERRLEFPLDPANVAFSRPIYPYPAQARYLGHGDPKDATSFGMVEPQEFRTVDSSIQRSISALYDW
jgi:hypothetical protein